MIILYVVSCVTCKFFVRPDNYFSFPTFSFPLLACYSKRFLRQHGHKKCLSDMYSARSSGALFIPQGKIQEKTGSASEENSDRCHCQSNSTIRLREVHATEPRVFYEEITEKSCYPIPLINETSTRLSKALIFTKLDVIAAFSKTRIKAGQEWMTAFNTRYGRFEYLVLPFGLCNAPSTFQSYVNKSLREFLDQFVTAYLDDTLVYSDNEEEHKQQVLDIDKCEFSVSEVKYLGIYVGKDGIRI